MNNNRNRIKINKDHGDAFDILLLSKEKFTMKKKKDVQIYIVTDKQLEDLRTGGIEFEYI
jgi:hypothetical protein